MTAHRWKAGQSGNPRGRKPGTGEVTKLRNSIAAHVPSIIEKLVEQAKSGDAGAARLLLERVLPPVRAAEQPVPLGLPDSGLVAQGEAILAAASDGVLAPGQAAQMLQALGALSRLVETEDLAARIAALEDASKGV